MQIHTHNNRRIIQHTDNHYDIEEYKPVLNELGEPFGYVWAVIYCSEDEMTPQRPIELVNASKACADAWQKRDEMIDAGDKEGVKAMDLTCDLLPRARPRRARPTFLRRASPRARR